jgi:hypothetical protein
MRERLDAGCIVILSNLGYSSSGEVLNCKYVILNLVFFSFTWHLIFWFFSTITCNSRGLVFVVLNFISFGIKHFGHV